MEDAEEAGPDYCRYYGNSEACTPPASGCVPLAGIKLARYVLLFYSEACDSTLQMEAGEFKDRAPLPPDEIQAYIDTADHGYRRITDPEVVVRRVEEYARSVLDLEPGERVFRNAEEAVPPISERGANTPMEEPVARRA